jgi:hypothetical protein
MLLAAYAMELKSAPGFTHVVPSHQCVYLLPSSNALDQTWPWLPHTTMLTLVDWVGFFLILSIFHPYSFQAVLCGMETFVASLLYLYIRLFSIDP